MAHAFPKKRQSGLKIEEFEGEVLVYDLDRHRAHCLNAVAARVWSCCDGASSVTQIAERVGSEQGGAPDEDLVWRALTELEAAALLDEPLDRSEPIDESRRKAFTQLGWAAGIPLVLSIAVPEPAFAQSGPTGSAASVPGRAGR